MAAPVGKKLQKLGSCCGDDVASARRVCYVSQPDIEKSNVGGSTLHEVVLHGHLICIGGRDILERFEYVTHRL